MKQAIEPVDKRVDSPHRVVLSHVATHAVRVILSGLFDELPNLNIILGHCGQFPVLIPRPIP